MRYLFCAIFAAAVAASSIGCPRETPPTTGDTKPGGLVFERKPFAVGATWVRRELTETSGTVLVTDPDGGLAGGVRNHTIHLSERRVEVLAVVEGRPTKARVLYVADSETAIEGEKKTETPTALSGRAYIVERTAKELSVKADDGRTLAEAELARVVDDHKRFGEPDAFNLAIPTRPLVAGETLDAMAAALRDQSVKDGAEVKKVSVRYVEPRQVAGQKGGAFEYELVLTRRDPHGTSTTTTKGVQVLRASDGLDLEETAEGESSAEHDVEADGSRGRSREVFRFAYKTTTTPK